MSKKKKRMIELNDDGHAQELARKKTERYHDQIVVSAKTEGQKRYIIEIKNNDITFCYGPAGSGKTAVAVGLALQAICAEQPAYDKLVVMRPAREACGERIGYLPGDLDEKMAPWAAPIMDNVQVFCDPRQVKNLLWNKKIEIIPIAYCRGRSLNNSFIIVDEAQNLDPKSMLMVLTRLGRGSKLVINGDVAQSDIRGASGLADAVARLEGVKGISIVELTDMDIVRHPLIGEILKRYSDEEEEYPEPGQVYSPDEKA